MLAAGALLLAGCSHAVDVSAPLAPTGSVASECAALVAAAPAMVAGQSARGTSPASAYVAAWGDPAIILRCGIKRPAALRPTSPCFVVNGVGWLVTQNGAEVDPTRISGTLDFTTIGRSAYVDVTVPADYTPASDALVDLADTIKQHVRERSPCR